MASGKIRGITVEIGGDTTKLGQAIADSEKKSRSLSGELKDVNRLLKFDPSNVELVTQKQEILTEAIEESRKKLDTLKETEEQIAKQFKAGEIGEEQFRAFQREIIQTESKINDMESELKGMNDELADVDDHTEDATEGFTVMKGAIANLIADGISTLASSVKDCMAEIVLETETAYDTFQAKTGVATESMEEFQGVIDELYRGGYGEGFEDIANAMAEIKQQTNETDPTKLKDLTEHALVLRDTFDFDVKESIRAVDMMMNQFGMTSDEAFNLIVQGTQNGLDKNGDLLDTINEYSVHYAQLGYSGEEFFNSLVNGAEAGTFSVDKLGDAMKEFGIRTKDTSTTTTDAFEALGYSASANQEEIDELTEEIEDLEKNLQYAQLEQQNFNDKTSDLTKQKNADKIAEYSEELELAKSKLANMTSASDDSANSISDLQARFAEGGETAKTATAEVLEKLLSMDDQVKQNEIGVALFGTMWEDLGIEGVKALTDTNGSLDQTKQSMEEVTAIRFDNVKSKWETIGRTIKMDLLAPLAEKLLPVLEDIVDYCIENSDKVITTLKTIGTILATVFVVNKISKFITSISTMVSTFSKLKTAITGATTAQTALNVAQSATPWGAIALAIGGVVGGIMAYNSSTEDATETTDEATTALDEFNNKLAEQAEEYRSAQKARSDACAEITNEFGYYSQLVDELEKITDENGNVISGYETRAQFIVDTLSEALGEEIKLDSLVAEGKQNVIDKIDDLIEKQKSQLILNQYEEEYASALGKRTKALNDYTEAEKNYQDVLEDSEIIMTNLNTLRNVDTTDYTRGEKLARFAEIEALEEELVEVSETLKTNEKAFNDAKAVYEGYQNTISNYEGASSAIIEGDSQKINQALTLLTQNFQRATGQNGAELEQQVEDAEDYLNSLLTAVENGMPGITDEMLSSAEYFLEMSEFQLEGHKKMTGEIKDFNEDIVKSVWGISQSTSDALNRSETHYFGFNNSTKALSEVTADTEKAVRDAWTGVSTSTGTMATGFDSVIKDMQESANGMVTTSENVADGVANNMANGTQQFFDTAESYKSTLETSWSSMGGIGENAGTDAGNGVADGVSKVLPAIQKEGDSIGDTFAGALSDKKKVVNQAGASLGEGGINGIESFSKTSLLIGNEFGQNTASGMLSKSKVVENAGKVLGNSGVDGFDLNMKNANLSGKKLGESAVDGVTSKNNSSKIAGTNLSKKAKEGIDSVKTDSSGRNFGQGFINGMDEKSSSIWSKAWSLGKKALNALKEAIGEASPAKETIKSGRYFTQGFVIGVNKEVDKAIESAENLGSTTLDALNDTLVNQQNIIRDAVGGITGEIVKENEDKAKAFENALKKIDLLRNADIYDDAQYYNELTYLRDTYLTQHSDKWFETTNKIYSYQKKSLDEQKKLYDEQKKKIADFFEDFEDKATSKIKEVEDAITSSEDKFTSFGDMLGTVTFNLGEESITFDTLADLDAQNKELETYSDNLLKIKERANVPTEFFEMLRDMSIEDGTRLTNVLLNATDADFDKYIAGWNRKRKIAQELTSELYADDVKNLNTEINNELTELENDFFATGENSAEQFEAGFLESFKTIAVNLRANVNHAFAHMFNGLSSANIGVSVSHIPQMARGGIFDTPTVVQVAEDGAEAIVPLENNTEWIDRLANKISNRQTQKIVINNDGLADKLDRIYDRLNRLQIVLDSGALVGETIDQIDARLADRQILSARGV